MSYFDIAKKAEKELHEVRKKRLKGGLGKGHLSLVSHPTESPSSPVTPQPHLTEAVPSETEVAQILAVWRDRGIRYLEARRAGQRVDHPKTGERLKPVGEHLADLRRWQDQWTKRGINS